MRRFNRFYTRQVGLLEEGLLASAFSLTEVRVLYELAHRDNPTASTLTRELGLDPGYVSRMLGAFSRQGLVRKIPSKADGRQTLLKLTARGRKTFAPLDRRSSEQVAKMLGRLPAVSQRRLVETMGVVEELLEVPRDRKTPQNGKAPFRLRGPRPGDLGWVVHRHGLLYAQEYGWDERFEALVAEIVAHFVQNYDPKRERCWIAEREGAIVGSVFLVKQLETVCKLRMLLVEPPARGLGIGGRLVEECIRFGRTAGYKTMTLWTNSVLLAARHIYEQAGFRVVKSEPDDSFGPTLIAETWERSL